MGKWLFLTLVFMVLRTPQGFTDVTALQYKAAREVTQEPSFSYATLKNTTGVNHQGHLLQAHLILDRNANTPVPQPVSSFHIVTGSLQRPIIVTQKQGRLLTAVSKDHFHHLFPFYHFW